MYQISYKSMTLARTAFIAFLAGCASPQPNVQAVAQTLQTYQVGKTTFLDFKRHTGLIVSERPIPAQHSYLNPQTASSDDLRPKTQKVYELPKGSPWKIYETGDNFSLDHGKYSETHKFVVGDINKPIAILSFDREGNLISVSPVR